VLSARSCPTHVTTDSAEEGLLSVRDLFALTDVRIVCRPLSRLPTMEDSQQDDYCVSSYTLFDILQAAQRLAELLPPQGCKTLAASCTCMRTWHRARVTVIRVTDAQDMALLQPQEWPRLVTVMLDSTSDRLVSMVDRVDVKYSLPAAWTQHATVCLGTNSEKGGATTCDPLSINTIAVLVQPAGLQTLQQQDKRAHVCTLKNLIGRAAPHATDMVIFGSLGAHITQMFAQHRWLCLTSVTIHGPSTLDADMVSHLGQFLPQSTYSLDCAHCCLTPEVCSSLSDIYWPGLRNLYLSDCSLDAAAMHGLSKAVWSNLNSLDLSQNLLSASAVKHLVSARLLSLKSLELRGSGLDAAAFEFLRAGNWPSLLELHLENNHIDIQGVQLLMQGAWPRLVHLGLTHNMLDEGVYALLDVRSWQQQCAGIVVSDLNPPYKLGCPREKNVALSRSTGNTWPRLYTVTVRFNITHTVI